MRRRGSRACDVCVRVKVALQEVDEVYIIVVTNAGD